MSNVKHSKFKNSAIIFELLSRQLTSDVLTGKQNESLSIIKKYFREGSELHNELILYHTLLESTKLREGLAVKLLDIILEKRKALDEKQLQLEKYRLIGELKRRYNLKDFFEVRLHNYRELASIYKIFESGTKSDTRDYIDNYSIVLESMTANKPALTESIGQFEKQNEDIKKLAFKLIIEKFNKKYTNLNGKQKNLISKFITENTNSSQFREYVYKEISTIQKALNIFKSRTSDASLKIKLNEVSGLSNEIVTAKRIEDHHVSSMIKYYELIEVLKQSELR